MALNTSKFITGAIHEELPNIPDRDPLGLPFQELYADRALPVRPPLPWEPFAGLTTTAAVGGLLMGQRRWKSGLAALGLAALLATGGAIELRDRRTICVARTTKV